MTTAGDIDAQFSRISDIPDELEDMLIPIRGFEEMPLVTLEEAVEPLISILPKVQDYAVVAKQKCKPVPADDLTKDQSASIILYTMDWEPHNECLYVVLNATLRSEDRRKLKPWFSYLKLIITALKHLPSVQKLVFRSVNLNLTPKYPVGKRIIWWGFSSCTSKMKVLGNEQFLTEPGERTMFTIVCNGGKDISAHSYFKSEADVLILPARQFVVEYCLKLSSGLNMIQIKETEPSIDLLAGVQFEPITIKLPTG